MTSSSTEPITLREAAQRLRVRNESMDWGEAAGLQEELNDEHAALATLLDGDGEGGLLHQYEAAVSERDAVYGMANAEFYNGKIAALSRALTLVAAYVSAVLGTTVEA